MTLTLYWLKPVYANYLLRMFFCIRWPAAPGRGCGKGLTPLTVDRYGHVTQARKDTPPKLFAHVLATVLVPDAFPVDADVRRQIGGGPALEQLPDGQAPLLRKLISLRALIAGIETPGKRYVFRGQGQD